MAHGSARFNERGAFEAIWPSKGLAWNRLQGLDARPYMAELVEAGMLACAPGPRGGQGWVVTPLGWEKARAFAKKQHPAFLQRYEQRTSDQKAAG